MKYTFLILTVLSIAWFSSCTKKIDVVHDIHDTMYISLAKADTFHTIVIHMDTVIKHDNHEDTVIQVRHDTLILTKTTSDTLFKNIFDTIYLTKTLHDTTTKLVYIHDTINNILFVVQHDTIIKINTVVTVDTVYALGYSLGTNYKIPATDSGLIYITYDTVPGFSLDSIVIINLETYIPGSQTDQTQAQYTQVSNYSAINYPIYGLSIRPVGPMICTMIFYYTWIQPNNVTTTLQTFDHSHTWTILPPNPTPGYDGTVHHSRAVFSYIDLTNIFFIYMKNHY